MFAHQSMAAALMPRANLPAYCFVTWICDGGTFNPPWTICGLTHTPVEEGQVSDPAERLQALRRQLEVTLAGVVAQESKMREHQAGPGK